MQESPELLQNNLQKTKHRVLVFPFCPSYFTFSMSSPDVTLCAYSTNTIQKNFILYNKCIKKTFFVWVTQLPHYKETSRQFNTTKVRVYR